MVSAASIRAPQFESSRHSLGLFTELHQWENGMALLIKSHKKYFKNRYKLTEVDMENEQETFIIRG